MIAKLHVVQLHQVLFAHSLVCSFFLFFFSPFFSQIESQKLTESEVMAIVMYTYDIMTMGPQHENFYFQLDEILCRRNVNLFSLFFLPSFSFF
jgi:hypothetical protein